MAKWAEKRSYCEIYEYPYDIIPPHHDDYKNVYNHHNSLAVCNNLRLQFFEPEEYVVKIDILLNVSILIHIYNVIS